MSDSPDSNAPFARGPAGEGSGSPGSAGRSPGDGEHPPRSSAAPSRASIPPERAASRPSARAASRRSVPRIARGRRQGAPTTGTTGPLPVTNRATGAIPPNVPQPTGTIPPSTLPSGTGVIRPGAPTGAAAPTPGPQPMNDRATGTVPVMEARNTGAIDRTQLRNASEARNRAARLRQGGAHQAPSADRGPAIAICAIVAVGVVGVLIFALAHWILVPGGSDEPAVEPGQPVEVVIPQGAGGDSIVSALVEAGVVPDGTSFMQAVSSLNADQKLQPGTYRLSTGMDPSAVVHQLMAGPNTTTGRLTVPEGLTVTQTADVVQEALGIPAEDFLAQALASNYVDDYPFLSMAADDSLEGFLWAKTYDFSGREVTADAVIRAMLDQYEAEIPAIDFSAGEAKIKSTYGIEPSDYDILILASIIEKESTTPEDLPLIASTFWNRMRDGMKLQSDATMGYVVGGEPTPEDLQTESPYNTYLNDGLPPTPICTPDLACIEAALAPADSAYHYFLIVEEDGYSNHTFSETYEEHLQAIDQVQRDRAARSS